MIKANELRLGNLIYNIQNEFDKRQIIVSGITSTMIACKQIVTEHKLFEPIQLTEDWLFRAGFIKQGVYYCKDFGHNNLKIKLGAEIYGYLNFKYFNHIQHAHQLQNLYFALTGSELVFSTEP